MLRGLLLDFYGTVVEDDDDAVDAIAAQVAAGAAQPVGAGDVARAWMRAYEEVARTPPFRSLSECAVRSRGSLAGAFGGGRRCRCSRRDRRAGLQCPF